MTLYFTINPPHQWIRINSKGIQDSGVVDTLEELRVKGQRCVAVVPGEQVNTRRMQLPIRNRQKLMAAIPFAIENSLVSQVDDLHFTVLNSSADNQVTFAYVSRDLMQSWLQAARQAGITLSALMPDYLLLPHASPTSAVITVSDNGQVLVRSGLCMGAVTDPHNLPVWLNELAEEVQVFADQKAIDLLPQSQVEKTNIVDIGSQLADWLSQGMPEHDAVLLNGEFGQGRKGSLLKQYWPAVAMLMLAGFVKLGSDITELVWLQKTQVQLEQSMQSTYQEFFPGSKMIAGRARVQTRNKILGLQSGSDGNDFTYLLVTTSSLLKNQKATVEELDYRQGNLITVLTLNDFAHLDRIKQQLQKEPSIDVKLKQSGARGNKVQVRFEISRVAA
ncbi:MAG: type II secretion system protein GspL [Arenicellales bacterium]